MELGSGFAFIGNQYKLQVGGEDYYLDLLFYNLKLRCYNEKLVIIIDEFQYLCMVNKAFPKPSATTGKYLNTLWQLDIIERGVPITEDNPEKSKS